MTKKQIILVCVVSVVLALTIAASITLCVLYSKDKTDFSILAGQVEQTRQVHVKWDTSQTVDEIVIVVTKGGKTISKKTIKDKKVIKAGGYTVDATYGDVKVKVTIKNRLYKASKTKTVNLFYGEYNLI